MTLTTKAKAGIAAGALALSFAGGYAAHKQPAPATIQASTEQNESAGLDLTVHQVKEPEVRWRTRTIVKEQLTPSGQVSERTTTTEESHVDKGAVTTDTGAKVTDDLHVKESVKVTELPRLHAFAEVGPTFQLTNPLHPTAQLTVGVTYDLARLGPVSLYWYATGIVPIGSGAPALVSTGAGAGL